MGPLLQVRAAMSRVIGLLQIGDRVRDCSLQTTHTTLEAPEPHKVNIKKSTTSSQLPCCTALHYCSWYPHAHSSPFPSCGLEAPAQFPVPTASSARRRALHPVSNPSGTLLKVSHRSYISFDRAWPNAAHLSKLCNSCSHVKRLLLQHKDVVVICSM
jgi:hypothetical protein